MKTLELHKMEKIEGGNDVIGGIGCALGVITFGLSFAALVTATGGTALLLAGVAYSLTPAATAISCISVLD